MLRVQLLDRQDPKSETGYGMMMMISIFSILLFSMMAAALTMSNLSKLSTDSYIDANNTFYVAESGLNIRAAQLRQKFIDYATPSGLSPGQTTAGSVVTSSNMSNCFPLGITSTISPTEDFECRNYAFRSNNNIARVYDRDGNVTIAEQDNNSNSGNYIAYTFIADQTAYATAGTTTLTYPSYTTVPADRAFAGIKMLEYKYTVYATAAKRNLTQPVDNTAAKTVLQMDFRSQIIPLFQFGVFYDGDLDISSHSNMNVYGRIHTNKTLIITPEANQTLTVAGANTGETNDQLDYRITAGGDIYTYDDANGGSSGTLRIVVPSSSSTLSATLDAPDGRTVNYNSPDTF